MYTKRKGVPPLRHRNRCRKRVDTPLLLVLTYTRGRIFMCYLTLCRSSVAGGGVVLLRLVFRMSCIFRPTLLALFDAHDPDDQPDDHCAEKEFGVVLSNPKRPVHPRRELVQEAGVNPRCESEDAQDDQGPDLCCCPFLARGRRI